MDQFVTWFNKQSLLLKIILLVIPFVGWVVELLIRLSSLLKNKDVLHIVVFVLYVVVGWGWVLEVIDIVWLILKGHLILAE